SSGHGVEESRADRATADVELADSQGSNHVRGGPKRHELDGQTLFREVASLHRHEKSSVADRGHQTHPQCGRRRLTDRGTGQEQGDSHKVQTKSHHAHHHVTFPRVRGLISARLYLGATVSCTQPSRSSTQM